MYNKGISTIFHMYQKCLRDIQSHYLQLLLQNVWYGIFITDCLVLTEMFFILWYYLMILSTRILSILEAVEWIQSMFLIKETVVSSIHVDTFTKNIVGGQRIYLYISNIYILMLSLFNNSAVLERRYNATNTRTREILFKFAKCSLILYKGYRVEVKSYYLNHLAK